MLKKTRKITEECGLTYLNIKSNICLALYQAAHAPIVPSVFLGAALALQKLFSTYYYSSAIKASQFSMNEADAAYYDLLNVHCLSSDSLSFYSSGIEVTRMDKIRYIADIDFVQKNLSVCLSPDQNGNNCGKCAKCTRTMAELEVIDKLVNFSRVFNIDSFWKNPGYHWGYVLLKSKTDVFCREIICEYKKTGRKLPLQAYLSRIQKWIERGFTTRNKQRIKVEEIIK
ncbi:hypothetical protein [Marispirochaeta aestuarii]|uniref:hypothetical protein n=1 Tax=Marispirochaeta aestuarii TaxID=1963862 RepID=UPI0029C85AFC|nr:hypothetical protein [Marispirochaeta aestuarii]